jgi:CubicO group peptidase (beta-lactamase class C family)
MMLVEEGVVELDGAIATYLDNIPSAWHSVTIRQILSHQSGLPGYTEIAGHYSPAIASLPINPAIS